MSRLKQKVNQAFCIAKGENGWVLAKRTSKRVTVTDPNNGGVVLVCKTSDMDQYRNISEAMEYTSKKLLNIGDTVNLDAYGPYYVIDSGYSEDGEVEYLIGR